MALSERRLTLIWSVLAIATLASFGTANLKGAGGFGFALIMLVAAFKARLIVSNFMELKVAPRPWRLAFDCLIGVSAALIIGLHLIVL
ncbi:MAG: hypothetical protein JWO15_1355 [Sphingomonadales bacterium]|nr:hypothetical protein [Sphingomonadales bacterium]